MGPKLFAFFVIVVFFGAMIGIGFYYNKRARPTLTPMTTSWQGERPLC